MAIANDVPEDEGEERSRRTLVRRLKKKENSEKRRAHEREGNDNTVRRAKAEEREHRWGRRGEGTNRIEEPARTRKSTPPHTNNIGAARSPRARHSLSLDGLPYANPDAAADEEENDEQAALALAGFLLVLLGLNQVLVPVYRLFQRRGQIILNHVQHLISRMHEHAHHAEQEDIWMSARTNPRQRVCAHRRNREK